MLGSASAVSKLLFCAAWFPHGPGMSESLLVHVPYKLFVGAPQVPG